MKYCTAEQNMPEDLYIVHNAFSLLLAISLASPNKKNKATIIFAHKKSHQIINSIRKELDGINITAHIITFEGIIPPYQAIPIKKYNQVFLSNPWHKRLIPFIFTIVKAKKIHLIDDGFATINTSYSSAIQRELGNTELKILKLFNKALSFDTHFSIFKASSDDFILSHKTKDRETIEPESIITAFTNKPHENSIKKEKIIILGSPKISAREIKNSIYTCGDNSIDYLLKDHPNLKQGEDDLGCPPEFYLIHHWRQVKKIHHCKSSTAYFSNYLFPSVETAEYTNE